MLYFQTVLCLFSKVDDTIVDICTNCHFIFFEKKLLGKYSDKAHQRPILSKARFPRNITTKFRSIWGKVFKNGPSKICGR